MLGVPHILVIARFFRTYELSRWDYVHYSWTLVYWLVLLGLPAMLFAGHRLSREREVRTA